MEESKKKMCPVCKKEMEEGYLQSARAVCWDKEIQVGIIRPRKAEGGFWITVLSKYYVQAPYCKDCKTMFLDMSSFPEPMSFSQQLQKLVKK